MDFFVYILECRDKSLYTGITTDLGRRTRQHSLGKGSRYVRSRLPARLVYFERFKTRSDALKRENVVKRMVHAEKKRLILNQRAEPLAGLHERI